MVKLFIIADDFTGALDTGVQFAAKGAKTLVITDPYADLSRMRSDVQVLVMDAETRHLSAKNAHDIVYRAVQQACQLGIPYIYKKTDSALRGNIGAELSAVLEASGRKFLPFLPAFPLNHRVTRGGVHYIGDIPVASSVFGQDPFEPVTQSDVCDLIGLQSHIDAVSRLALRDGDKVTGERGIVVYDAETDEDLRKAARVLQEQDSLHIMAGCAGFGAVLPELIGVNNEAEAQVPAMDGNFTVLCGSVNPITLAQLEYADHHGFAHIHITPEQKLESGYFAGEEGKKTLEDWKNVIADNKLVIFDANDEGGNAPTSAYAEAHGLTVSDLREKISATLGSIMKELFHEEGLGTLLVTGGDTLLQCMNRMGVYEMEPICELYSGVVLSRFTLDRVTRFVISKSGGFGQPSLLSDMVKKYMS